MTEFPHGPCFPRFENKIKIDNLICKEVIFKSNHLPKSDMLVLCEDSSDIRRRRHKLVVSNIVRPTYLIIR